jgi:hypothetical protein
MKKVLAVFIAVIIAVIIAIVTSSCEADADVASRNISKAADMFEVDRRIVFYNGITNDYILVIEGKCSLGNYDSDGELTVTCKTGHNEFKKHFLGLSDNVTFFAEQLDPVPASVYNYRVIFKPESIIPDIDLEMSK